MLFAASFLPAQALSCLGRLLVGFFFAALMACQPATDQTPNTADSSAGKSASANQVFKWKLVTSWPKNYPGLGMAPETFANYVNEMSAGRLQVRVYGAGELVPALEVFDTVSQGTAELGHSGAYYWKGKSPASVFFTSVPFGLTAQEMNGWIHYGGGLQLWQELYAPFNLLPLAGGNTGVQMAGWFNKEINTLEDLKGLKIRMPGLGGEVMQRLGASPVLLPGGEIFTALQTGAIDATEWVGPYNDLAFGLHRVAKYYYYPGWHEPGPTLEFMVNKDAFAQLPEDLQAIVRVAARAANQDMLDEYTARNNAALQTLIDKHQVQLRPLPKAVLAELRRVSAQVVEENANQDPLSKKIHASYQAYRDQVMRYQSLTEQAYLNARSN